MGDPEQKKKTRCVQTLKSSSNPRHLQPEGFIFRLYESYTDRWPYTLYW